MMRKGRSLEGRKILGVVGEANLRGVEVEKPCAGV